MKDEKFARSSSCGFVAQWSERPTGNRKTQVRSPAGLRCVFFSRLIQLSVDVFVGKEKERFWFDDSILIEVCSRVMFTVTCFLLIFLQARTSLRWRLACLLVNVVFFSTSVYLFLRHNTYCEPYSILTSAMWCSYVKSGASSMLCVINSVSFSCFPCFFVFFQSGVCLWVPLSGKSCYRLVGRVLSMHGHTHTHTHTHTDVRVKTYSNICTGLRFNRKGERKERRTGLMLWWTVLKFVLCFSLCPEEVNSWIWSELPLTVLSPVYSYYAACEYVVITANILYHAVVIHDLGDMTLTIGNTKKIS